VHLWSDTDREVVESKEGKKVRAVILPKFFPGVMVHDEPNKKQVRIFNLNFQTVRIVYEQIFVFYFSI
jgi:hypothetical protein